MTSTDLRAHAQALVDGNRYLTLGTVGADGTPWTSPVYFAADGLTEFYWTSETSAQHSVNLSVRSRVSAVVFDSTVEPYHGRALYSAGSAAGLTDTDEIAAALMTYPRRADRVVPEMTDAQVTGASSYRLYRMTITDLWVLCPREPGRACLLHDLARDHRARVPGL